MPQLRNARILSLTAGATAAARIFLTSDVQYISRVVLHVNISIAAGATQRRVFMGIPTSVGSGDQLLG